MIFEAVKPSGRLRCASSASTSTSSWLDVEVPHKQQIHDLLKAAALGGVAANKIVDAVTTEGELAFIGNLIAFIHQITVYVRNIRNTRDYARTIAVAQAALYGVTLVQFRIDGIDLCDVVVQESLWSSMDIPFNYEIR